ncbi:hypothetical protein [Edaphocola flava]|uniref:hypothetical protein n=1 Tax=Edaphocola flava TaxID=2499629 RepID=UPI00100B7992|nr:hypothetical protein [Edaphocola flava]
MAYIGSKAKTASDELSLNNLWESYKKNYPIAAGATNGAWNFVSGTLTGLWEMAKHPVNSIIGLGKLSIATNPGLSGLFPNITNEVYSGLYHTGVGMVNKFKTGDSYTRSSMVTEGALTILSMFVGGRNQRGDYSKRAWMVFKKFKNCGSRIKYWENRNLGKVADGS